MTRPTPSELRATADVIERWADLHGYVYPKSAKFTAESLRREADVLDESLDVAITLHVAEWTRMAEVEKYADRRAIGVEDAIRELTNSGLSHLGESYP